MATATAPPVRWLTIGDDEVAVADPPHAMPPELTVADGAWVVGLRTNDRVRGDPTELLRRLDGLVAGASAYALHAAGGLYCSLTALTAADPAPTPEAARADFALPYGFHGVHDAAVALRDRPHFLAAARSTLLQSLAMIGALSLGLSHSQAHEWWCTHRYTDT